MRLRQRRRLARRPTAAAGKEGGARWPRGSEAQRAERGSEVRPAAGSAGRARVSQGVGKEGGAGSEEGGRRGARWPSKSLHGLHPVLRCRRLHGAGLSTPPPPSRSAEAGYQALPRSKLVRDPGSFGYRRLLPFLNKMAKNGGTNGKGMPSENSIANPKRELPRSYLRLVDESLGGIPRESDPMVSMEPVVVDARGDHETKYGCNNVREETNAAPHDLMCSKQWLNQCLRLRVVHHPSSFSYKRMLPFLMENDISSLEGNRVEIRRIAEERQPAPNEHDVLASG